jgi:hypothetical protein
MELRPGRPNDQHGDQQSTWQREAFHLLIPAAKV